MALLWVVYVSGVAADAGLEGGSAWWGLDPGLAAALALLLPDRHLASAWDAGAAVLHWTVTLALFTSVKPWKSGWTP
ncbi:hypothetical protein EDD90_5350 [Streptomyces sp. Ag109_O5-1]|nr:hypothetical protein EDD90_5350 [Streptomyces sp. Ag109_O5-1]